MSDGLPSKYGDEAKAVLEARSRKLFAEYDVKLNVIMERKGLPDGVAIHGNVGISERPVIRCG